METCGRYGAPWIGVSKVMRNYGYVSLRLWVSFGYGSLLGKNFSYFLRVLTKLGRQLKNGLKGRIGVSAIYLKGPFRGSLSQIRFILALAAKCEDFFKITSF
jgi:hypothetical protein